MSAERILLALVGLNLAVLALDLLYNVASLVLGR